VAPDGTQQVTISVVDGRKFAPGAVNARGGQPVILTLRNTDTSAHDLTVNGGLEQAVKLAASGGETAGQTVTF